MSVPGVGFTMPKDGLPQLPQPASLYSASLTPSLPPPDAVNGFSDGNVDVVDDRKSFNGIIART